MSSSGRLLADLTKMMMMIYFYSPAESKACNENTEPGAARGSVVSVLLDKAGGGAGLGFGLDGGRDSPQGDRPLTVKKLFAGTTRL